MSENIVKRGLKIIKDEGFSSFLKQTKEKIKSTLSEPKLRSRVNQLALTEDEENILERNLVWIFGAGRSGTTWLARELLSYQTHMIDEPYLGHHLQAVNPNEKVQEFHNNRISYFFCIKYKEIWRYYLRKLILIRIHAQIRKLTRHIIIKEPHGTFGSGIISECLPNSKIIVVIRDSRDNLDSEIDSSLKGGWNTKISGVELSSTDKIKFIKNYSKSWVRLIEILMKTYESHTKNLRLLVKYEDLRKDTVKELEKIYNFLEIGIEKHSIKEIVDKYAFENIPSDQKGSGKSRRAATPGLWKKKFNEEEKEIINSLMGKTLEKLGYTI